jgi:hypothetical protein
MTFVSGETQTTPLAPESPRTTHAVPAGEPRELAKPGNAKTDLAVDRWSSHNGGQNPEHVPTTPASGPAANNTSWHLEPAPIRTETSSDTAQRNLRSLRVAPSEQNQDLSVETEAQRAETQLVKPSEQTPLGEMDPADATRYFAHLDIAFADIDTHRGVMHGPMAWPPSDTPQGQERVENLVAKLFKPKERPESAYTTLILYMPAPNDPKRNEKLGGFASAAARQLRTMVEQGAVPLVTATVLHQAMARHAANGSPPKEAQTITRMFERKRLEVVAIGATEA